MSNSNRLKISKHARKRLVERYNIDRNQVLSIVKLAKKSGLHEGQINNKNLLSYIGFLYKRAKHFHCRAKIVFHNYFVFVFNTNYKVLITVFPLPENLVADYNLQRKIKIEQKKVDEIENGQFEE